VQLRAPTSVLVVQKMGSVQVVLTVIT